ncbi:MAG: hypothetical protein J5593_04890 [Bacteroidaceae bacterium]|nr:hypothetical protein [Bacteroidaceae bacterium]
MIRLIHTILLVAALLLSAAAVAQTQVIRLFSGGDKCAELTFKVTGEGTVHVDWGNGVEGDYSNGMLAGKCSTDTVTITMPATITGFDCEGYCIKWLDVSGAPNLVSLNCADNRLVALNVDELAQLDELNCSGNEIDKLSTTHNGQLRYLDCAENFIDALDVSANPLLEVLSCSGNRLTSLNVGQNNALRGLWAAYNAVGSVDLSLCPDINSVMLSHCALRSVGMNAPAALQDLWLDNNTLTTLDLKGTNALVTANVSNNTLESLDLRNFSTKTTIYLFDCSNNSLPFSSFYPDAKVEHYVCGLQQNIWCGYDSLVIGELTDFAELVTNAGGTRSGVLTAYDASTDDELLKGSTGSDYQYLIGRVRFWHEIDSVYFTVTASKYPDLEIRTNSFVVYDPEATGIHDSMLNSQCPILNDQCYDLSGRQLSSPPKNQIYIRNRKKVLNR